MRIKWGTKAYKLYILKEKNNPFMEEHDKRTLPKIHETYSASVKSKEEKFNTA